VTRLLRALAEFARHRDTPAAYHVADAVLALLNLVGLHRCCMCGKAKRGCPC
jgi:hypothetical protein